MIFCCNSKKKNLTQENKRPAINYKRQLYNILLNYMKYSIKLSDLLNLTMPKYIHSIDGLWLNAFTLIFVPFIVCDLPSTLVSPSRKWPSESCGTPRSLNGSFLILKKHLHTVIGRLSKQTTKCYNDVI